jgi:hypothetical protein
VEERENTKSYNLLNIENHTFAKVVTFPGGEALDTLLSGSTSK